MQIKLNTGIDVRTGPNDEEGRFPSRRIGEAGDVLSIAAVPEWNGVVPQWLLDDKVVEVVEEGSNPGPAPAE
jgi:hypothetical protein